MVIKNKKSAKGSAKKSNITITVVISCLVGFFTLISLVYGASRTIATNSDIQTLNKKIELVDFRLEQKIISDRSNDVQGRIWKIEDRYGKNPMKYPVGILDEWRKLNLELKENDDKIQQRLKQIH